MTKNEQIRRAEQEVARTKKVLAEAQEHLAKVEKKQYGRTMPDKEYSNGAYELMRDAVAMGQSAQETISQILKVPRLQTGGALIPAGMMMALLPPLEAIERAGVLGEAVKNDALLSQNEGDNLYARFVQCGYNNMLLTIARAEEGHEVLDLMSKLFAMAHTVDKFRGKFIFDFDTVTLKP